MFKDGMLSKVLSQVGNNLIARLSMAAVYQHKLVVESVTVTDDNSISGFGSVPNRQKLDLAVQSVPPTLFTMSR